jgi:hypothetical protein
LSSRFKDRSSEGTLRSGQKYYFEDGYPTNFRTTVERVLERLRGGFERGSKMIKSFKKPKSIPYVGDQPSKEYGPRKTILDPQGQFLQTWNKIFVLCCVISLALDPLFFYIPVIKIEGDDKCLYADKKLTTIACVLRTLFDTFYVLHIIFQFRTGYIAPSSRVVGMGDTINDPLAIAKRYLSTYFIIDILSILPFPQVCMTINMKYHKSRLILESYGFCVLITFRLWSWVHNFIERDLLPYLLLSNQSGIDYNHTFHLASIFFCCYISQGNNGNETLKREFDAVGFL